MRMSYNITLAVAEGFEPNSATSSDVENTFHLDELATGLHWS
jgi:hypothetical protein